MVVVGTVRTVEDVVIGFVLVLVVVVVGTVRVVEDVVIGFVLKVVELVLVLVVVVKGTVVEVTVVVGGLPVSVQLATDSHSHRFVFGLKCVPGGQHCIKTGPFRSQR